MGDRYEKNVFSQQRRDFYEHDDRERGRSGGGGRGNGGNPRYFKPRYDNRPRQDNYHVENRSYNNDGHWRGGGNRKYNGRPRQNSRFDQKPHNTDAPAGRGMNRMQMMYEQRRGGKRRFNNNAMNNYNKQTKNNLGWHKIIIQNGGRFDKNEVLTAVRELVEEPFVPIMYDPEGNHLVFYLEDNGQAAEAIVKLGRRISLPGSREKLYIVTNRSAPPIRVFTPEQTKIITEVMSNRYSVEMNRLDLKNFHNDIKLVSENIFCPLNRSANMQLVLTIIKEHIPSVKEIDFGHNKIPSLEDLGTLLSMAPHLCRLSLEKNKIASIHVLDKLKGLQISDLTLTDNPLCDKFKDQESYISAVRKCFPKVLYLDGNELPKPVTFELEEETTKLPTSKDSFFCNDQVKTIVERFIVQYYQIFDTENRRPLEAAYTEDAQLSISLSVNETGPASRYISPFLHVSRNLKKVMNSEKRQDLLAKGRTSVIEMLEKLPHTTHDPLSFVIDVPIASPQLVKVVLTGVFRQIADKVPPIRAFMRSFIIIPVGEGVCISNEMITISTPTVEQVQKAFKQRAIPLVVEPAGSSNAEMPKLTEEQQKLIEQFQKESGMLPQYCGMCLEQNNWNFAKAGEMFLNLKQENKIPPEYYPQL